MKDKQILNIQEPEYMADQARRNRLMRETIERMADKPIPLPSDGVSDNTPITWDAVEGRLEGKPWPEPKLTNKRST